MDFNNAVIYAVGATAIITLLTTASTWVVFRAEFERETQANQKADVEHSIRAIEKDICEKATDMQLCMLLYNRYEALRTREEFSE